MKVLVIRGFEGGRYTFVGKILLTQLSESIKLLGGKNCEFPEFDEQIRQRLTTQVRGNIICKYLEKNLDSFIFPEVIAICEHLNFSPISGQEDVGYVETDGFIYLPDGQGRKLAVDKIIAKGFDLGLNSIDIKFVQSDGLKHDQQIFADVNSNFQKTSSSITVATDSRSLLNVCAKAVIENKDHDFNCYFDYLKTSVNVKSEFLWTLSQLVNFITIATGKSKNDFVNYCEKEEIAHKQTINFCTLFFNELFSRFEPLHALKSLTTSSPELKENTIIGTAIFIEALGYYAFSLLSQIHIQGEIDWSPLDKLNNIDFSRNADIWRNRCFNIYGKFQKNSLAVMSTAYVLIDASNLPVPAEINKANLRVVKAIKELQESNALEGAKDD